MSAVRTFGPRWPFSRANRRHGHRVSRSASRPISVGEVVWLVAIVAILLFAAFRIVLDTAADNRAWVETKGTAIGVPSSAAILDQAALNQVKLPDKRADLRFAHDAAEQALRADPLDTRALAIFALIDERQSRRAHADKIMALAAIRTWRDPIIESWMFIRNVQQRHFAQALVYVDAMLRIHPELVPQSMPSLTGFVADPAAREALANILATAPPWREQLLSYLCDRTANVDDLLSLYNSLYHSPHPPTVRDLDGLLTRLLKVGRYWDAYSSWAVMASPNARDLDRLPYNGDFSVPPTGLPFDWSLRSIEGANIDIVTLGDRDRRNALHVQFSGARVYFDGNVTEVLLLAPGDFHLTGDAKTNNLVTTRGLWWQIACVDLPRTVLGHSELVSQAETWTKFGFDFHVPNGCAAQRLSLLLPARTTTEHQIEGEIMFRNLYIAAVVAQKTQSVPK